MLRQISCPTHQIWRVARVSAPYFPLVQASPLHCSHPDMKYINYWSKQHDSHVSSHGSNKSRYGPNSNCHKPDPLAKAKANKEIKPTELHDEICVFLPPRSIPKIRFMIATIDDFKGMVDLFIPQICSRVSNSVDAVFPNPPYACVPWTP